MTEELGTYSSTRRMTIASSPGAAITCEEKRYTLIQKGGPGGPELYNFGKPYAGFYNPVPQHVIWIGFGPNRSGPDSSTVAGMIASKLWASWDPRPAYANQ